MVAGLVAAILAAFAVFSPTPPAAKNTAAPTPKNLVPSANLPMPIPSNTPAKPDLADTGEIVGKEAIAAAALDDPKADGWDTEVFADSAVAQLKHMGKLLADPGRIDPAHLEEYLAPDFRCGDLRARERKEAFHDGALTVARGPCADAGFSGAAGLADALAAVREPFAGATGVHAYFKIFRVVPSVDDNKSIATKAYFEASGPVEGGSVQLNGTWNCTWVRPAAGAAPRLSSIAVVDYEEVVAHTPQHTLFSDCTVAVLGKNDSFQKQLRPGTQQWAGRLEIALGIDILNRVGLAVGDANGDGLDDLYVCQPGGLPNRLYVQNPDGTATDRSAEAGVDWMDYTRSALFVDLDNDGDQDLVVATSKGLLIMANDGTGKFTLKTVLLDREEDVQSVCAADYDGDGDLDLYVCCYNFTPKSHPNEKFVPVNFLDANDGAANYLLRNDGAWSFADVTNEVGLGQNNRRLSLAAMWEDYDNDGDPDLYVANDFGRDCLYRNDGGKFVEVGGLAGADDPGPGMSVTWGDYDHDGNMDIYVSNMWSSAGGRITYQPKWKGDAPEKDRARYQYFARGNTLYHNLGNGKFEDVSEIAGVTMGRWAWSSNFVDVNNDGWEDLFVANGYITGDDPKDL